MLRKRTVKQQGAGVHHSVILIGDAWGEDVYEKLHGPANGNHPAPIHQKRNVKPQAVVNLVLLIGDVWGESVYDQ